MYLPARSAQAGHATGNPLFGHKGIISKQLSARQGFEPQYSPSKGEVLPLDDRAMFPSYTINPTLNLAL